MQFIPVLEVLSEEPRFPYLAESMAIIEWAEETHPSPPLLPVDPWERARVRQLAELINAGTQPLQNLRVQKYHSADETEQTKWNRHWSEHGLSAYEQLVQDTAGKFSFENQISLADLFLIPQCYNALRREIPIAKKFPTIHRIYMAALETEACKASAPERFQPSS